MSTNKNGLFSNLKQDTLSSIVVFLVALPLCLGIALASGAAPLSGLIAGIIGGIVVGYISSSPLSVSGPAAGLIVIVIAAIDDLGSFNAFLVAIFLAGLLQIGMGLLKAGVVSNYFPSSVIKGMLAAIGLTLIFKQLPHLIGADADAFGEMEFFKQDGSSLNPFSFVLEALGHITQGAVLIGVISLVLLLSWDGFISKKFPLTKQVPGSFIVVIIAIILNFILQSVAPEWAVFNEHLVAIPRLKGGDLASQISFPDFSILSNPDVYVIAITLAIVASLESLLSAEAVERLDPENRKTEGNRELIAQGIGNTLSGLVGGLPITAVIVRSSANLSAGAKSKLSTMLHGALLLVAVLLIPRVLNMIPLSALAAVLIMVGYKLCKPTVFKEQWAMGIRQFAPFVITLVAIFFSDLLYGIIVGLVVGVIFILIDNHKIPFLYTEKSAGASGKDKKVVIRLSEHVSFLNKASLQQKLAEIPDGVELVIDAGQVKSIDLDVLELIHIFEVDAQARNISVVLLGSALLKGQEEHDDLHDEIAFNEGDATPSNVLNDLMKGNERFISGLRKERNYLDEVRKHSEGQDPKIVVLGCIDSRAPVEIIMDKGIGDVFSIRVAGNVVNDDVLGSMEFACSVKGAKVLMVLGHTGCGAVAGACGHVELGNLTGLLAKIKPAIDEYDKNVINPDDNKVDAVARINVQLMLEEIKNRSEILGHMDRSGEIIMVGAMYDVDTGKITLS